MGNVVENLCKYTGALLGIRAGFAATLPLYDDGCGGSAGPDAPGGGLSRRKYRGGKKNGDVVNLENKFDCRVEFLCGNCKCVSRSSEEMSYSICVMYKTCMIR